MLSLRIVAGIGGNTENANDVKIGDSSRSRLPSYTDWWNTAMTSRVQETPANRADIKFLDHVKLWPQRTFLVPWQTLISIGNHFEGKGVPV